MAQRSNRDDRTLDLLAWEPPELVHRFEESEVRAATLRDRISRAVSAALGDSDKPREEIAEAMSVWLGEDVSKAMLDAYASQAREDHTISYLRLLALIHVTGDDRLLQLGAELFGLSVIEDRWLPWVEVGRLADRKEELDREYESLRRAARKGVRP